MSLTVPSNSSSVITVNSNNNNTNETDNNESNSVRKNNNKVANLPYPALKLLFWYLCTNPGKALATYGSVCNNWRSILQVTGVVWDRFVSQRWPHTPPEKRTYETFIARHKKAHETVHPINPRDTTAIEDCDLAFKCPMLLENLQLVQRAVPGGSGPVFHCDGCNKNVYTVRTQAEKDKCALDRQCVIFDKRSTHPGSSIRVRVALVTNDKKDSTEEEKIQGVLKAKKALNEIRAVADLDNCPSSISTNHRLIVEVRNKKAVAEFRHVPRSQLIDVSSPDSYKSLSSYVTNPETGNKERPFIPDVVLFLDDPTYPANFESSSLGMSIRLGETSISAATMPQSPSGERPEPLCNEIGDFTTPLDLHFDVEDKKWCFGTSSNHYLMCKNGPRFGFRDVTKFLLMADTDSSFSYSSSNKPNSAENELDEYFKTEHPEMNLVTRTPGSAGIFICPTLEVPKQSILPNRRERLNDDDDNDDSDEEQNKKNNDATQLIKQKYPVFEVLDENDNLLNRINFFDLACQVFSTIRENARNWNSKIDKFFKSCEMLIHNDDSSSQPKREFLQKLPVIISVGFSLSLFKEEKDFYSQKYKGRLEEVLGHCGFELQTARKESGLVTLGTKNFDDQRDESIGLQIRCGGRSSTVEEFCIEEGILENRGVSHINDFCGERLDNVLANWMLQHEVKDPKLRNSIMNNRRSFYRLTKECMRARHRLSSTLETHVEVDALLGDFDLGTKLTRAKMEDILRPEFDRFIDSVVSFVTRNNNNQVTDVKDIALSGGLCNTPKIIYLLERAFPNVTCITNMFRNTSEMMTTQQQQQQQGHAQTTTTTRTSSRSPITTCYTSSGITNFRSLFDFDPSTVGAVAALSFAHKRKLGNFRPAGKKPKVLKSGFLNGFAALKSVDKATEEEDQGFLIGMLDVMVLTLSVGDASTGTSKPVVRRNTTYPTRKDTTLKGNQLFTVTNPTTGSKTSELRIYEGERTSCDDNNLLGAIQFPQLVDADATVTVKMDVDANGILVVDVVDLSDDFNSASITITNDKGRLSKDEIERMIREAEAFKFEDELLKDKVGKKNEIESKAYTLNQFLSTFDASTFKFKQDHVDRLRILADDAISYTLSLDTQNKISATTLDELENYSKNMEAEIQKIVSDAGMLEGNSLPFLMMTSSMPSSAVGGMPLTIDDLPGPDTAAASSGSPQIEEVD